MAYKSIDPWKAAAKLAIAQLNKSTEFWRGLVDQITRIEKLEKKGVTLMDWEQLQQLSQGISIAITEGMQNGFEHMPEPERITLHDFFAGCALTGIMANPGTYRDLSVSCIAALADKAADDMMKER